MNRDIQTYEQQANVLAIRPDVEDAMQVFKAGLNIKDATDAEYRALAHLSLAHNLDPFNGEAWIIPGHGTMVGIKGLRKAADNDLPSGCFYHPAVRLVQPGEFAAYALNEEKPPKTKVNGQWVDNPIKLAAICELTRSDATQQWVEQLTKLTEVMGDYAEALHTLGPKPVWIGVGIVRQHDRSKMELTQLAFKRAESDATKRAFNLQFAVDIERQETINGNYETIDAEAEIVDKDGQQEQTHTEPSNSEPTVPSENTLLCEAEGEQLYAIQRDCPAALGLHEKHFQKRWQKRWGVRSLKEIKVTYAEFMSVMADDDFDYGDDAA